MTGRELCSGPEADLLARVFPDADCDGSGFVTVGHGHFWERLLIRRVHALPDAAFDDEVQLASDAVGRMYASQYRQVRAIVSNNGHTRAVNVNVRVPIGFSPLTEGQSISPFTLGPDEAPVERFYRTAAGVPEVNRNASSEPASAAVDRFGVDWERDENAQTGVVLWVGVAFLVLWIAIVFNDNRLRARRDVEGDAAPSE